jgi:hypothetical protein
LDYPFFLDKPPNWQNKGLSMQAAPFKLSKSQKTQVTLLYHFASLGYLKELRLKLNRLMVAIDPTLDLAEMQRRDPLLTSSQWGTRDTSKNWGDNGWPILADFEQSIAMQIAKRASESYAITEANNCERGLSEISTEWMTPDEQDDFDNQFQAISAHAKNLDDTINQHERAGRWDDFSLTLAASEYRHIIDQAPLLRIRPDIVCNSAATPIRTGVYLPADDPHGTPQFCWVGNPPGVLLESNTFNDLGLEALATIGRDELWLNETRMLAFAQQHANDPRLTQDPFFDDSISDADLAPSLVARNAFTSRPCHWIYVEQIHGERENWTEVESVQSDIKGIRVAAGMACPEPGYYFTPAKENSRRFFAAGEVMPNVVGDYGVTIWQKDAQ